MPTSKQGIPENWPPGLIYLSKTCYSPNVSASLLTQPQPSPPVSKFLQTSRSSSSPCISSSSPSERSSEPALPILSASATAAPSPLVRIARIADRSHPACGQHGLFASQDLSPGSFILCYLGWTHSMIESDQDSSYDLALDRELGVAVDATRMGNEARFINDYRGIGTKTGPNAEFKDVLVSIGKGLVERRAGVFVLPHQKSRVKSKAQIRQRNYEQVVREKKPRISGIAKGEEILVSYGKGFWSHQHAPDEVPDSDKTTEQM